MDTLIDEANHALAARGYAADEAAVYADGPQTAVLRGSLVKETPGLKTELLNLVSMFPLRDDLVAALRD